MGWPMDGGAAVGVRRCPGAAQYATRAVVFGGMTAMASLQLDYERGSLGWWVATVMSVVVGVYVVAMLTMAVRAHRAGRSGWWHDVPTGRSRR